MTFVSKSHDAKQLDLPGRNSKELISNIHGSETASLRLVKISPPKPTDEKRKPHFHPNCEECIYVLSGLGRTHSGDKSYEISAGDSILISMGEPHYTENTGTADLTLLCFFPSNKVEIQVTEKLF